MLGNIYPRKNNTQKDQAGFNNDNLSISLDIEDEYTQYEPQQEEVKELSLSGRRAAISEDIEREQIDLGLDARRMTYIDRFRYQMRRWENLIQVLPFWKTEVNTINITFSALVIIALSILIIFNYPDLPTKIPLFYEQVNNSWLLVDKTVLVITLIFLAGLEVMLLRMKRIIFDFDRRLSGVMATTQIFFNVLAAIALVQIISLVLI